MLYDVTVRLRSNSILCHIMSSVAEVISAEHCLILGTRYLLCVQQTECCTGCQTMLHILFCCRDLLCHQQCRFLPLKRVVS